MNRTRLSSLVLLLSACGRGADDTAPPADDTGDPPTARRMPGEHEPHAATLLAWPWREDLWGARLEPVQDEFVAIIEAISAFEDVIVAAEPGTGADAASRLGATAEVVEIDVDDSWARDSGPLFVEAGGARLGLDFGFNGWGGKFEPFDADDALPRAICDHLGVPWETVEMVLEGGAILVDGEGTLVTTEECLLDPNRNPGMTREDMEAVFREMLGVTTVIWLPYGVWGDWITNGHVDGVAAYVEPGVLMVQALPEGMEGNPNGPRLDANRAVLEAALDARGRTLDLVDLPHYAEALIDGQWREHTYINFYVANGGVIVPTSGWSPDDDEAALAAIQAAFPERQVVGVPTPMLDWGGGGIHCVTQQVPAP